MTGGSRRVDAERHPPGGSGRFRRKGAERHDFVRSLQEHHPKMRNLAIRILHDVDAADDALQDAYIKAYQKRATLRDGASMSSWLYTIVYRSSIDQYRRRRPTVPYDENVSEQTDTTAPFEQTISRRLGLREAMAQINPEQRAAIWLIDAEGMTFSEAAEVLGVPSGTVGSRVSRARAALRQLLSEPTDPTSEDRS